MCQYSADDGFANDWHRVHLGSPRRRRGRGRDDRGDRRRAARPHYAGLPGDLVRRARRSDRTDRRVRQVAGCDARDSARPRRSEGLAPTPAEGGDPIPADRERGWETVSATDAPYPDPDPNSDADDGELASTRRWTVRVSTT